MSCFLADFWIFGGSTPFLTPFLTTSWGLSNACKTWGFSKSPPVSTPKSTERTLTGPLSWTHRPSATRLTGSPLPPLFGAPRDPYPPVAPINEEAQTHWPFPFHRDHAQDSGSQMFGQNQWRQNYTGGTLSSSSLTRFATLALKMDTAARRLWTTQKPWASSPSMVFLPPPRGQRGAASAPPKPSPATLPVL